MSKARDLANIISGSGTLNANVIPNLPTSKITSGTFDDARLSSSSVTQHVDLSNLNASNLTSGSVPSARLSLGASDIPNLSANKITSDTFDDARLSSSSVTQHVDLSNLSASNLTSGTIPNARYGTPTFNGSNLTSLPSSAPTTSQVLTATASASVGAVGSYGLLKKNGSNPTVGSTASSNLYWANCNGEADSSNSSPSGTWRVMGHSFTGSGPNATSTWLRIS